MNERELYETYGIMTQGDENGNIKYFFPNSQRYYSSAPEAIAAIQAPNQGRPDPVQVQADNKAAYEANPVQVGQYTNPDGTRRTPSSDGPNPFGLLAGVAAGAMLPSVLSGMPSMPAGWDEGAAFGGTAGPSMTTAMGPASQVGGAFTNNVVDPLEGPMTNWGQPNPTNPYNGSTSWPNDSVTAPDGSTPPNGGAGPGMPSLSQLGQGASIASALKNFFGGNGSLQSTLNGLTSGNGSNGSNGSTDWGKVFSGLLGNSLSNDAIRGTVNSTLDKLINSDQRRTTQPLYEGMFRDVATNGLGNTPLGRNIASSVFRQDAAKGYGPNEGNAVHDVAQGLNSGGVGVMQALTPAAFFQPSPLYAGGQALSTLAGQQASNQGNLGTVIQEVGKSLPSLSDLFKTSGNTTSGGNDSGNWFQSLIGNTNTTNPETNPNWSMA